MGRSSNRAGLFLADIALLVLVVLISVLGVRFCYIHFYKSAYPIKYSDAVMENSSQRSVPQSLVYAVIRTESGFNPAAQSSIPARGLMQITQETFDWAQFRLGQKEVLPYDALFDGETNIYYGTVVLQLLLAEFGSESNALCAYHAGWGSAKKWLGDQRYSPDGVNITNIPFEDTNKYVTKVLQTKQTYEKLYNMT